MVFLNGSWKVSYRRFTCRYQDAGPLAHIHLLKYQMLLLIHLRLVHDPVDCLQRCSHAHTEDLPQMASAYSQQGAAFRNGRACCS